MAFKQFVINQEHAVTVYKRRSSRSLRLSVSAEGKIRVSIPSWTPYKVGLAFAESRLGWIQSQLSPRHVWTDGQPVGKSHRLSFVPGVDVKAISATVSGTTVRISHPVSLPFTDQSVQVAADKAAVRALRLQAQRLLPQRLGQLASKHGFSYRSVKIRQLRGRWGSCDMDTNITLSLYLMRLPWELIDYVLLHELTHTKVMRHGPDFWRAMRSISQSSDHHRRELRRWRPVAAQQ